MGKNQNPKLKKGDRIVLVYMPGENLDTGTKGKVTNIGQAPSFGSEFDYLYEMEWYDEDDKVISVMSLLPEADSWLLDPEYRENNLNESKITDIDYLIDKVNRLKTFKKSELTEICKFLELERRLGTHNMYLEGGKFLLTGSEYIKDYIKLKSYENEFNENNEILIDEILKRSEQIRTIFVSKALDVLEKNKKELSIQNMQTAMKKLVIVAKSLWMEDSDKYKNMEI